MWECLITFSGSFSNTERVHCLSASSGHGTVANTVHETFLLWISAQNHIHPAPGTNLSTTTNAWDLSMDATRHKERWRTSLIWICIEMHESSPMIRRQGNSCQRVLFSRGRVVFSISRCLFTIIDSLVNLFYPLRAAVFSLCNNQNRVNY